MKNEFLLFPGRPTVCKVETRPVEVFPMPLLTRRVAPLHKERKDNFSCPSFRTKLENVEQVDSNTHKSDDKYCKADFAMILKAVLF